MEANDKGEERKCPKYDVIKFCLMYVRPACFYRRGYNTNAIIESFKK